MDLRMESFLALERKPLRLLGVDVVDRKMSVYALLSTGGGGGSYVRLVSVSSGLVLFSYLSSRRLTVVPASSRYQL